MRHKDDDFKILDLPSLANGGYKEHVLTGRAMHMGRGEAEHRGDTLKEWHELGTSAFRRLAREGQFDSF